MYKTLKTMNESVGILSDTRFVYNKCETPKPPAFHKYLETMFFSPLKVPEEGKVIQSPESNTRR